MNCAETQSRLSAYHDGELSPEIGRMIEAHLATCRECQERLATMEALSDLVMQETPVAPPAGIWDHIQLHRQAASQDIARRRRILVGTAGFLVAAILLLIVAWRPRSEHTHDEADHATMDRLFDQFLNDYEQDPAKANRAILAAYENHRVDGAEASRILKARSVAQLPMLANCQLQESRIVAMPCCKCIHTTFVRKEGKPLLVFEHTKSQMDWFGQRPSQDITCAAGNYCRINLGADYAMNFEARSHHVTVVGVRNDEEAEQILQQLIDG